MTERTADQEPLVPPDLKFGVILREHRKAAGMRQKDLADKLGWSISHVSMVERGERPAKEDFASSVDPALNAGGALLAAWRKAQEQAARLPLWFRRWVEIEQSADALRTWQPLIIPGLLQTVDYARALLGGKPGVNLDRVEASLAARIDRQHILGREDPPMLWVILDEGVLTRPVGDKAVMAGQMDHLLAMAERPRIVIRVLPRDSWNTTGLLGAFVIARGRDMPDMAYVESAAHGQVTGDPDDVTEITARYEMIHGEAQSQRASCDLIREARKQWTT
ncbi:helix-turn-helix transcriptional regulator [Streptosporangium sp. NPDC023825]|uniref:helix-turn-helix domain-containing protein n=1 Tax=Streptosporangium sp. NPDC023825 TaxID=3154909 RepID=UPI00342926B9